MDVLKDIRKILLGFASLGAFLWLWMKFLALLDGEDYVCHYTVATQGWNRRRLRFNPYSTEIRRTKTRFELTFRSDRPGGF